MSLADGGEGWGAVVGFIERHAWIVAVALCFVLFVPQDVAVQVGLDGIRTSWRGWLWVGLVVTFLLTLSSLFKYLDRKLGGIFSERAERMKATRLAEAKRQEEEKAQKERKEQLSLRLGSLNAGEQDLIFYCLVKNQQSFNAYASHPAASSLSSKGLIDAGAGSMLSLSFHFPDWIWRHLLEHRKEFVSEDVRPDHPQAAERLNRIQRSFSPAY